MTITPLQWSNTSGDHRSCEQRENHDQFGRESTTGQLITMLRILLISLSLINTVVPSHSHPSPAPLRSPVGLAALRTQRSLAPSVAIRSQVVVDEPCCRLGVRTIRSGCEPTAQAIDCVTQTLSGSKTCETIAHKVTTGV